ncbi:MAG: FecR domain-containing protein [Rhizobiaceae bacterium]|nr:FecR domain-containing protein [Rhizobiaceae bacterium]
MRSLFGLVAVAAGALACTSLPSVAKEQVGQATLIRTAVTGDSGTIAVKSPVYRDERIRTSKSGLGEFRFVDGTKFAVGGNSSVVIDRFVYDSSKTFESLTLNAARGSFRWISGKSKSDAYKIVTPAGTIGVRGTRFDIYVGPDGTTSVVLLSGRAQFCGSNGCQELRRRCDVVVATPGGGVTGATRVDQSIFQQVGNDRAFPFLTGRQQLSRSFYSTTGSCGLSAFGNSPGQKDRGDGRTPSRGTPGGGGNGGGGDGGGNGGGGDGGDGGCDACN